MLSDGAFFGILFGSVIIVGTVIAVVAVVIYVRSTKFNPKYPYIKINEFGKMFYFGSLKGTNMLEDDWKFSTESKGKVKCKVITPLGRTVQEEIDTNDIVEFHKSKGSGKLVIHGIKGFNRELQNKIDRIVIELNEWKNKAIDFEIKYNQSQANYQKEFKQFNENMDQIKKSTYMPTSNKPGGRT